MVRAACAVVALAVLTPLLASTANFVLCVCVSLCVHNYTYINTDTHTHAHIHTDPALSRVARVSRSFLWLGQVEFVRQGRKLGMMMVQ